MHKKLNLICKFFFNQLQNQPFFCYYCTKVCKHKSKLAAKAEALFQGGKTAVLLAVDAAFQVLAFLIL